MRCSRRSVYDNVGALGASMSWQAFRMNHEISLDENLQLVYALLAAFDAPLARRAFGATFHLQASIS